MAMDWRSERVAHGRPFLMGIVNVTPDSFSDGGRHLETTAAVEHALSLLEQGADWLDIGGESTRPGAGDVPLDEELRRVVPVIEGIRRHSDRPISIDTSKPEVMRAAVAAGAGLINDVRALRAPGALEAAAELRVPVCLMHMQGQPRTMQQAPRYDDVVVEVEQWLRQRVAACTEAGMSEQAILVDPGIGFGKTLAHNLALMRACNRFDRLAGGVLMGVSRKSWLDKLLGLPVDARACASVVTAALMAQRGMTMVRVHDVAETAQALRLVQAWEQEP